MANNFASNFTRQVMMKVAEAFESERVISKNVNTQLFQGAFDPNTGDNVDIKRPTDYQSYRSSAGDISANKRDIVTGKATATVQDYITVGVDFNEADEALKMGTDADRFWDDIARRIVTDLEVDFANYMMINSGLASGDPDQPVNTWQDVAKAGALMNSIGVPMSKPWCYALNPYSQVALSNEQRSLGVNPEASTALKRATLTENFAGFQVMSATSLSSYTTQTGADRVGALASNPDVTYVTAKDSMTQTLSVSGFQADLDIKAGEVIEITGRYSINQSTKTTAVDETGASIPFRATVTADVTLSGTGTGDIVVTGPAVYEASGGHNTVDSAPVSGDVVTLLGSASTVYKPNMFWHPDAFAIASVPIKKLYSTDTIYTSADGLQLRTSKYADGDANSQTVRIDLRPAYAVLNPFFAGHGYGNA